MTTFEKLVYTTRKYQKMLLVKPNNLYLQSKARECEKLLDKVLFERNK